MPYNMTKVKQWIKKSAKGILIHNANEQLVSDSYAVIQASKEMLPTILEIFGHLEGGQIGTSCSKSAPSMRHFMVPGDTKVVDSQLCYTLKKPKKMYRILRHYSGKKIVIDGQHAALFKNFEDCTLTQQGNGSPVSVSNGDTVIGAIALYYRSATDILDAFNFIPLEEKSDQKGR